MLTADDLMVVMFGESFAPAGETLRIAALLTLALGFSNLFGSIPRTTSFIWLSS